MDAEIAAAIYFSGGTILIPVGATLLLLGIAIPNFTMNEVVACIE